MSIFKEDLFTKGVKQRVSTVGHDYVKKNLDDADEFFSTFSRSNDGMVLGFWLGR